MKRSQKTGAEQVALKLRQIEVRTAQGRSLAIACREAELFEQSYHRRRKEYGGLQRLRADCEKGARPEGATH